MEFKDAFKRYKRFIKEKGVFHKVMSIHSKEVNAETILKKHSPFNWLRDTGTFCIWAETNEGERFWWRISLEWQIKCIEESIVYSDYLYGNNTIDGLFDSCDFYISMYKSHLDKKTKDDFMNKVNTFKKEYYK